MQHNKDICKFDILSVRGLHKYKLKLKYFCAKVPLRAIFSVGMGIIPMRDTNHSVGCITKRIKYKLSSNKVQGSFILHYIFT